jgi:hypothetical protein
MGPFGIRVASRLKEAVEPTKVSVLTTLVSGGSVASPITGIRAAIVVVDVLEHVLSHGYEVLGTVVLGDLVTLRDDHGDEITVVVGKTRIVRVASGLEGVPLEKPPAELVPLLSKATGRGVICYRELTLGEGAKVRLKAVVEPRQVGYSGTKSAFGVRDDLAPVVLEEVFDAPAF